MPWPASRPPLPQEAGGVAERLSAAAAGGGDDCGVCRGDEGGGTGGSPQVTPSLTPASKPPLKFSVTAILGHESPPLAPHRPPDLQDHGGWGLGTGA